MPAQVYIYIAFWIQSGSGFKILAKVCTILYLDSCFNVEFHSARLEWQHARAVGAGNSAHQDVVLKHVTVCSVLISCMVY